MKGFAIAAVVAGHVIPGAAAVHRAGPGLIELGGVWIPLQTALNPIFSIVYAFHMPLFAFVSGLVLWPSGRRSLDDDVLRRVRSLFVPYLSWLTLGLVLAPTASQRPWTVIVDGVIGRGGGLWYLYVLLICVLILAYVSRLKAARWLVPASALVVVALKAFLPVAPLPVLYVVGVLSLYPFVVLGYLVAPVKEWLAARRGIVGLLGLTAFLPLYYFLYPSHVPSMRPSFAPIAAILDRVGLPGAVILTRLFTVLPELCGLAAIAVVSAIFYGRDGVFVRIQSWLGRRSLGIYAIHGPLIPVLVKAGVDNAWVLFAAVLLSAAALTAALERIPGVSTLLLGQPAVRLRALPPRSPGGRPGEPQPEGIAA